MKRINWLAPLYPKCFIFVYTNACVRVCVRASAASFLLTRKATSKSHHRPTRKSFFCVAEVLEGLIKNSFARIKQETEDAQDKVPLLRKVTTKLPQSRNGSERDRKCCAGPSKVPLKTNNAVSATPFWAKSEAIPYNKDGPETI